MHAKSICTLIISLTFPYVRSGSLRKIIRENRTNFLDFDYEDGERQILDDLTDETGRQLPQLPPLIVPPHIPSPFDSLPTLPPFQPAAVCANWWAFCFTILYGARKCCIGIVCPPFGIVCDPNEKKTQETEEEGNEESANGDFLLSSNQSHKLHIENSTSW